MEYSIVRHSVINHCDRHITHLSDLDTSFLPLNISSKFLLHLECYLLSPKRHSKTTPNKMLLNLELLQVVYYVQGTCTYGIAQAYSLLMLNFIPSMIIAAQPWHCCSAEAENLGPILWPTCRVSQREFLFLSNPPWHQYELLS